METRSHQTTNDITNEIHTLIDHVEAVRWYVLMYKDGSLIDHEDYVKLSTYLTTLSKETLAKFSKEELFVLLKKTTQALEPDHAIKLCKDALNKKTD